MTKTRKPLSEIPKVGSRAPILDPRWWIVSIISAFAAYAATSYALFFYGSVWQVPIFVGCVVGLVAIAPIQASLVAPTVMVVSMLALPPLLPTTGSGPLEFGMSVILSAGSAAAVAYGRFALTGVSRKNLGVAVSTALVLWTLVNLWLPLLSAGLPVGGYGTLSAVQVRTLPQPGGIAVDDVIYRRVFSSMHEGKPYYESFRDAWIGQPAPSGVMGFRLPTYFWTWRLLPPDLFSTVYLYLALCSVGVVSAALITGQLVGARFAPLAAVALAAYAFGVGLTLYVVYVDLPAMSVALAGIAIFVRARLSENRRMLWAAVGMLVLAALAREILAYLLAFAALSAVLESPGRRLREATPWLAGLGAFSVGYAAHIVAVRPYLSPDSQTLTYLSGGWSFMVNGVTEFANGLNGHGAMLAVLFTLGVVGAIASSRRVGRPFAAFATAALVVPMLAMLQIGNAAIDAEGNQINYWGMLVVPFALSLWPVWALLLQRRQSR